MTNEEIQKEIIDIKARLDALADYATIPLNIGEAIKARILVGGTITGATSGTSPITTGVNEAGIGTYNVASPMTGFITIVIDGTQYLVPYY